MAIVDKLEKITLERDSKHSVVNCTYAIVQTEKYGTCIQLDTYGSDQRKIKGKKSQSIRLSNLAIKQLKKILANL